MRRTIAALVQLTARSWKGVKTLVEIRGFQEFMNRVDGDRLQRMPPDTFEKLLPYAMALGMENRWAQNFAGMAQGPPAWFQGIGPALFSPIYLIDSLGAMSQVATSTLFSAPRAGSGSSGWGAVGGLARAASGFSGGGFGDGGGGAF